MTSVLLQPGEHTHSGDPVENSLLAVRDHMKAKAVEGRESNHQILLGAAAASSDAVASQMPSVSTMRRTLRKQRRRAIHPYTIPTTKRNLEIPVEFKVSPSLFYQVYTIHGSLHGTVVPLVFALLSNKTQSTYARLFSVLRAHINHLNVKVIYTDFELAAMNSFQNQFPGVRLQACFFHLAQSVYRKVQENHDLRQRYDTDKDFSVLMRMLPALAFIPLGDLDAAFDSLMEIFPDEAMPLAQYFEDTYLGRRRGLRRISPMFAPSLWNVNDAVHQHLPRTNNSAEAWHRGFQSTVACASPTIWAFLAALKKEQALTEMKLAQASTGHAARMPKRKYQDCNMRIENILSQYVQSDVLDTLRAVAFNIGL
ncbi:hypothetical protein ISCGN_012616 [Ixodes scapularis]